MKKSQNLDANIFESENTMQRIAIPIVSFVRWANEKEFKG